MTNSERWLSKISKLHVYRAKWGLAPHKPLLLLVILDLAEEGTLPEGRLALTPELAFRFCTYWSIVAHRRTQKPDVQLPFYHLQSEGFWTSLDQHGERSPAVRSSRYADLDRDFVDFAKHEDNRLNARSLLIAKYFQPDERLALYTSLGMPIPSDDQIARDRDAQFPEEAGRGREARFRLNIVAAYSYTCALTGYRLMTISAGSIIDAAHIHQFSDSRNNDIRNGIALSKNAHWLFDNGLWTIGDDYRVIVAKDQFVEESPDQKSLADYHGRTILLPDDRALHPDPIHLAWHRRHTFCGI